MIADLQGVLAYTDELGRQCPELASEMVIRRGGDLGDQLPKVSRDLHLPPIYEACVAKLGMFGVSLGYFSLWPGPRNVNGMIDALYRCNVGQAPIHELLHSSNLVAVATEERNLICVGAANHQDADIVHFLDLGTFPKATMFAIAPDFEKFLILAANLNKVAIHNEGDPKGASSLLASCCEATGCTEAQAEFWVQGAVDLTS